MKISYKFANETVEIEVSENWGNILIGLDRQEYNVDHKETRRHCSLDGMDYEGDVFAAEDTALTAIFAEVTDEERLHEAIAKLQPKQQELLRDVYFGGMSVSEYAMREGVDQSAISHRLQTVYKKIKKFL